MISAYRRLPLGIRRLVFAVVHGFALFVAYSVFVEPWMERRAIQKERLVQLGSQLDRFQRLAAREREVQDLVARAREDAQSGAFWSGETEAVVSAAIQSALRDLAEESGLKLRSVRGLAAQQQDAVRSTAQVRLEAFGNLTAIHAFLTRVEQATPYLFGQGLLIRNPVHSSPEAPRSDPQLELQLDVVGYLAKDGA